MRGAILGQVCCVKSPVAAVHKSAVYLCKCARQCCSNHTITRHYTAPLQSKRFHCMTLPRNHCSHTFGAVLSRGIHHNHHQGHCHQHDYLGVMLHGSCRCPGKSFCNGKQPDVLTSSQMVELRGSVQLVQEMNSSCTDRVLAPSDGHAVVCCKRRGQPLGCIRPYVHYGFRLVDKAKMAAARR